MSDLGFFPKSGGKKTKKSAAKSTGPVVLNPYKPRAALKYELMTREELVGGKGGVLIADVECFSNYFLVAFKSPVSGHVLLVESLGPNQIKWLLWIIRHYTLVGFNILKYDMPLMWMAATGSQDLAKLKEASNMLIAGSRVNEVEDKFNFIVQASSVIDLIEVCPLRGSLKLYGARLHAERIQDVPWGGALSLEPSQVPVTRDYCVNDLSLTELLYGELNAQLKLREDLGEEYSSNFMSKSDAQIAEDIIRNELRKRGRNPRRPGIEVGAVHRYASPKSLVFKTKQMKDVLAAVCSSEFVIDKNGYLECPQAIEDMEIAIGSSVYRMGLGGLHSSEKNCAWKADKAVQLFDRDVASYYPAIVVNCGLAPSSLGDAFLDVYKTLIARRMDAKRLGLQTVSENLKVCINGTFGKTGSPYSILYAPEMTLQITVSGQLFLLMLIEMLEGVGVSVVSANTDGVIVACPRRKRSVMLKTIASWEKATGFITEETEFSAIYSRDVNAYLAVGVDGKVKGKNVFYDPWRDGGGGKDRYWRFQKNPSCQICVEAVEKFLVSGIDVEKTIRGCSDITRFLAVKNVTGGAHKDGDYLGKVVRWYYASGESGVINYITNGRIVADTHGARPLMDLPAGMPDDVDYDWYISRALEMMEPFK